jgi:SagB-type dehydrogenase family enzyme
MRPRVTAIILFLAPMLAANVLAPSSAALAQQTIQLPAPRMDGGMPLMSAIAKRQSIRAYSERRLPNDVLSNLLWAAFGINRRDAGERTAPSWRGGKEIDIYVATSQAVWMYDPAAHALRHVMEGDIRAATGRQSFPATAPLVLIYVADRERMAEAPEQEQYVYAHADAAFIAQNVYLFAASEGLGTVVLGNVEKAELAKTMKLRSNQILTFTQPIGYPR